MVKTAFLLGTGHKGGSSTVQHEFVKGWVVSIGSGTIISPGINCKSRVWFPGPRFLSSAAWPLMPKKHYKAGVLLPDRPVGELASGEK